MPSNRATRESGTQKIAFLLTLLGTVPALLAGCDDPGGARGNDGGPFANIDAKAAPDAAPTTDAKDDAKTDAAVDGTTSVNTKDAANDAAKDAPSGNNDGGGSDSASGSGGTTGSGGSSGSGGAPGLTCEQCQQQNCKKPTDPDFLGPCFNPMDSSGQPARATAGPAMGMLKSDLCKAVLTCVQNNADKCINWAFDLRSMGDPYSCYCGKTTSDSDCLGTAANGPCKAEFEAAAEINSQATAGIDVANAIVDPSFALGAAVNILGGFCDQDYCRGPCLGLPGGSSSGSGGTAAASTGGATGAGGKGGAGGKAGAGGAGGAGGKGGAGGGSAAPLTFLQCRACEQSACPSTLSDCEQATGNATAGPKTGTAKKELCLALVACMRNNHCVKPDDGDPAACYCGAVDDATCSVTGGSGPCKAEWEAAAESTSPPEITGARYTDPTWASGLAFNLVGCDSFNCQMTTDNPQNPSAHCFDGDPVAAGGRGGAGGGGRGGAGGGGRGGTPGNGGSAGGAGGTPSAGGAGGTPVTSSGGVTGSGGASSSGGTSGALANGRFDANAASWVTEYGMLSAWSNAHDAGGGAATSGALAVTNPVVVDLDGSTMGGARQCLTVPAGSAYTLAAQTFIAGGQNGLPAGQIGGSAAMNVSFYPSADCSGISSGLFMSTPVTATNAWTPLGLTVASPTGAQSMAIRLVVTKTFRDGAFQAFFDNVTVN